MSDIAEELIVLGLSVKRGELVERQSFPIFNEMLQRERYRLLDELHQELRQAREQWAEDFAERFLQPLQEHERRNTDRLAALTVKAIREGGISRRMLYTLLATLKTPRYALEVYEDAKALTGKDVASRVMDEPL